VIREATKAQDVVSVSRVVLGRRERAVILEPRGEGIVVWTLRFGDEVQPEVSLSVKSMKPGATVVSSLEKVIKKRLKEWSPALVTDPTQEGLPKLIVSKKETQTPLKRNTPKAKEGRDQKPTTSSTSWMR
jgi:DNA end-binding protein Ku